MRPRGHRDVARDHPHARLSTTEYSSTLPAMIQVDISMCYGEKAAVEELAFGQAGLGDGPSGSRRSRQDDNHAPDPRPRFMSSSAGEL
jgi:hypothetical protein